jgi:hypothetical protein
MTPARCPNCAQPLPDERHPQDKLVAMGGLEIPVIVCPSYTEDTLMLAPSGSSLVGLAGEATLEA